MGQDVRLGAGPTSVHEARTCKVALLSLARTWAASRTEQGLPRLCCDRVLTGQERFQQREQGVRSVQWNDVATVLDDVCGEVIGDGAELAFQCGADRVGAHRHGWHGQAGGGDGLRDLQRAFGQSPVVGERAAQRVAARVCVDEGVPDGGGYSVAECAVVEEPVDVGGLVAFQHGLGEAGCGGMEAEPPRLPAA